MSSRNLNISFTSEIAKETKLKWGRDWGWKRTPTRKKKNGREPNDRSCRGKPSIAKENQRGINAEKSQATKRVRKYNNKIRRTDGGERDPHRAFIEYVGHRPNRPKVITLLKTST